MADLETHAARVAELVERFEANAEDETRRAVFELLEHIDHMHRTCVWRLFELITELGGKGLVDRIAVDPAVKTLFMLYDLIPSEPLRPIANASAAEAPNPTGFIPLESLRKPKTNRSASFALNDLPIGMMRAIEIDGRPLLLLRLEEGAFAYRNACGGTILPLHLGTLAGSKIHCPWHGCLYDAKTGERIDGSGLDLERFPVRTLEDTIEVSFDPIHQT